MIYQLRQKIFCFGDDFTINDQHGRPVYVVDGAAFTIRDSTSIRDMQGHEVAHLRRRLLSLGMTYEIERGGHVTVVHKHLFTLFKCRFSVDVPGPNDLEATGNFLDMEYQFQNAAGTPVASVSKKWISISDSYGVEIAPGQDDVMILAAVVVIDLCCHGDRK